MSIGRIAGKGAAEQLIGIEEMLRKQNEKQLEAAQSGSSEVLDQRSVLAAVKAANTNVMSSNFAQIEIENSRYVEASLKSMTELRQQKNSMIAEMWANSDQLGGLQGPSRQLIEREQLREQLNTSSSEISEDIERKAKEAQVSREAEGGPIPGAEIAGGVPLAEDITTPPVHNTGAGTTTRAVGTSTSPDPAAPAAAVKISLDIRI